MCCKRRAKKIDTYKFELDNVCISVDCFGLIDHPGHPSAGVCQRVSLTLDRQIWSVFGTVVGRAGWNRIDLALCTTVPIT